MLKDNEWKGLGNSYDFGARMYDSRLGRWMSLDPLASKYPFASPYNFVLNSPIQAIDPDGRTVYVVTGSLDVFGIFVGYGVSTGIAMGDDGLAFVGAQTWKAGIGLEASAGINFNVFPTMNSVNDLGGAGYSLQGAGAFGGAWGGSIDKSGDYYGGTVSYGVGAGAHLSGNVGYTDVKKVSWQTLKNFFNGVHNPDWPLGDYWSQEDRQEMRAKFINGIDLRRGLLVNEIQKNNKIIDANNEIINKFNEASPKERDRLRSQVLGALDSVAFPENRTGKD